MKASRFLLPLLCLFFVADVAPGGCRSKSDGAPRPKVGAAPSAAVKLPS